MITCTITVVLSSTVVFGLLTKHLVRLLLLPSDRNSAMVSSEPSSPNSTTLPLLGYVYESEEVEMGRTLPRPPSLRMLLSTPTHTVHYYWRKVDDAFMRPVFGGRGFAEFVLGSPKEESIL
ncbi:UNVERIFIED_CONTAM: Sodium/hydrogen exchanger 2 [Sesamum radiatum]